MKQLLNKKLKNIVKRTVIKCKNLVGFCVTMGVYWLSKWIKDECE